MENQIIKDIAEIKGEMKYLSGILKKMESVLERQISQEEKMKSVSLRITNIEQAMKERGEKCSARINNLEDWKIGIVAKISVLTIPISVVVSTISVNIVNFLADKFK